MDFSLPFQQYQVYAILTGIKFGPGCSVVMSDGVVNSFALSNFGSSGLRHIKLVLVAEILVRDFLLLKHTLAVVGLKAQI